VWSVREVFIDGCSSIFFELCSRCRLQGVQSIEESGRFDEGWMSEREMLRCYSSIFFEPWFWCEGIGLRGRLIESKVMLSEGSLSRSVTFSQKIPS
jgi:hypothetical protein